MKKRSAGLLACVALACHGQVADDGKITGRIADTWITEQGDVSVPAGPKDARISAVCQGPRGWSTISAAVEDDGTFTLRDVPSHDCWVRMDPQQDGSWPVLVRAATSHLELGHVFVGRPDGERAVNPTPFEIRGQGLIAWADRDELDLFSLGAGAAAYGLGSAGGVPVAGAPATGATSIDMQFDVSQLPNARLVDGALGDRLFVTHLSLRGGGLPYWSIEDALRPQMPEQHDGQPAAVEGAFAGVHTSHVGLDWRESSFFFETQLVNPNATLSDDYISVVADPAGPARASDDDVPYLLHTGFAPKDRAAADTTFTATIANPYPGTWTPRLFTTASYKVPWLPDDVRAFSGSYGPLDAMIGKPLAPELTPPRQVTVGGQDATGALTHTGTTPVIAWHAPPEPARLYELYVYQPGDGDAWALVADVFTDVRAAELPPDLIDASRPWVAFVAAYSKRSLSAPEASPGSDSYAAAITGLLTP